MLSPLLPLPQPVQVCDVRSQTWPALQPPLSWQVPATQAPPLQMWLAPYSLTHWASALVPLQAPQVNGVCDPQMRPVAAQSPLVKQLPATQAPALQTWSVP